MREVLYEESAVPSNEKTQKVVYTIYTVLMWVMLIATVFTFTLWFMFAFWFPFIFTLTSTIAFAIVKSKIYYCVDCIFVSGSTRIVKVINYKRRKKIIVFDSSEVIQVGKLTSGSFNKLSSMPNIKRIYGTPNKYIDDGFYVYLKQNSQDYLLILECKETYLQHLVAYTGRQVIEKDYK